MLQLNTLVKPLCLILISAAGLSACDPSFTTTAQECVTFDPVRLAVSSYEVQANEPNNEYKLYLEDTLNSLKDLQSTSANPGSPQTPSADELEAIQFIIDKANQFLGYEINNGKVTSANNALDFLESLIAATDENETILTFVNAKNNVAKAIANEDSVCNYRNKAIEIVEEQQIEPGIFKTISTVNAQLDINYNPFNSGDDDNVDQVILLSLNEPIDDQVDNNQEAQKLLKSFNGFQRISASDFNAIGISPPEVRQLTVSEEETNQTFFFDDDFDTLKLGQIVINQFNTICRDDEGEPTTCPEGTVTREPEHPACKGDAELRNWLQGKCPDVASDSRQRHPACPSDGGPAEEAIAEDETGQVKVNNFTVVSDFDKLENIQRYRLESDYPNNEIRIYASKHAEAILRAGADPDDYDPTADVIYNPTNCEQQAVLDDLAYLEKDNPDFDGVRLTLIEDPNYDVIEADEEDGEPIEPEPIFSFQGTVIPERQ